MAFGEALARQGGHESLEAPKGWFVVQCGSQSVSAAAALAVEVVQAAHVLRRAGVFRLGVLLCTQSAALALAVAQAALVLRRAGMIRLCVLGCTQSAALALAVEVVQAAHVLRRAGVFRLGVLRCAWSAAAALAVAVAQATLHRAEARWRGSLWRSWVHSVSCVGAGSCVGAS